MEARRREILHIAAKIDVAYDRCSPERAEKSNPHRLSGSIYAIYCDARSTEAMIC